MELLAISKDAIRGRVIRYFHDVFHDPISAFKGSTNVRKAYSYSDRAWHQLANVFNKLSWMEQLDVILSPREMPDLKTIDDLTNAIWGKLNKVVSVSGLGTRITATGVRKFASSKRGTASKSKRKATNARRKRANG